MFKVGDKVIFKPEKDIEKLYEKYEEITNGIVSLTENIRYENKQLYGKVLEILFIDEPLNRDRHEITVVDLKHWKDREIRDRRGYNNSMSAYIFELQKINI